MDALINITLWIVLIAHLLMALIALWRIVRGENAIARLTGLDLASTLMVAVLVIISLLAPAPTDAKQPDTGIFYLEVAIAAVALGYLTTIAIAKFISDHKVF